MKNSERFLRRAIFNEHILPMAPGVNTLRDSSEVRNPGRAMQSPLSSPNEVITVLKKVPLNTIIRTLKGQTRNKTEASSHKTRQRMILEPSP